MARLVSVGALVAAGLVAAGVGPASANVTQSPNHGGKLVSVADGTNLFEFLQDRFAAAVGSVPAPRP